MIAAAALGSIGPVSEQMLKIFVHRVLEGGREVMMCVGEIPVLSLYKNMFYQPLM